MQLRWDYAALLEKPEQCSPLPQKQKRRIWQHRGEIWQQWKMIQDHCLLLQWSDESAVTEKRHTWMFIKVLGHKGENWVSLFWAPDLFVLFWRSSLCWCCPVCVLPGPPSHILWLWPLLWTAPQFNLPNVRMSQANQPLGRLQGPAKHFQLWHT